jgi:hypothetical protein
MVDEDEDRAAGDQLGEERHAVLDVDDQVRAGPSDGPQRVEVDPELVATPAITHTVTPLAGVRSRVGRALDLDAVAVRGEAFGHPLDVPLRAAAFGMPGVTPVDEQHTRTRVAWSAHRRSPNLVRWC